MQVSKTGLSGDGNSFIAVLDTPNGLMAMTNGFPVQGFLLCSVVSLKYIVVVETGARNRQKTEKQMAR